MTDINEQLRTTKLQAIETWAQQNPAVRALLLTSSLVNPLAPVDSFSDLDIELVFDNNEPYLESDTWLSVFGDPIAMIEEGEACFSGKHGMKMVLYRDGIKVDFKLYSAANFVKEVAAPELPEDWDIGYRILLDKDGLTSAMKPPTHQVSIIKKPSVDAFKQLLNDFWWDTTYVAKCLARDEIFYAKFMSENNLRTAYLVPLLEWYIASQHHWNITTNKHGRLFKQYLSEEEWEKLELTFSGSVLVDNWKALFAMMDIVHEIGKELAARLNYAYLDKLEEDIRGYILGVSEFKR
ncbi:AadS family aminoglycoside 6-adenylyltransferase [Sphingobacterium humi]|uniref:AadS family aminoglycoside 6-adenylyltransferase n=1 Tax=Sphingobacterium humi TaxID=1796905 RepID=A0A6N8KTL7_9SPHI|nr:AadS family aminoglycoside 6-adenylyltransferase [Sphingobacterium humi]MVZ60790.1 AadS family aminoglycoside 6-adenylyltransferase [Sphingobacterium humi]